MTTTHDVNDVQSAAAQHPVGRTEQNDFREQGISQAAEHATWERSTSDLTPASKPTLGVSVGDDLLAAITVSALTGADLGATKAISPAVRLLADDPTRRRAVVASMSDGAGVYIAPSPEMFQGFADRVATAGALAVPMPGMCALTHLPTDLFTTRALWVVFVGAAASTLYVSAYVERATRTQP